MYKEAAKEIGATAYSVAALAAWNNVAKQYPADTLFQAVQRKPDSVFVAQSLKEQVSMWDYLQKLERDLLSLTFVERTNYNAFFKTA